MSLNKIRRIVSGKKARFVDPDTGTELDLCYVTDRIIICGWPASGIESLYRNDRASVRSFLTSRYGTHFRIFNFCPRFENEYDAAYFNNQVSRFPFPDHHPPPLSLIPLAIKRIHEWLEADAKNVIVIHCKAGKGRSGTMCCCYLLSLPTLPKPPQIARNYSKGKGPPLPTGPVQASRSNTEKSSERAPSVNSSRTMTPANSSDDDDGQVEGNADRPPPPSQSGGAAMDLAGRRGTDRHNAGRHRIRRLVENLASSGDETGQDGRREDDDSAIDSDGDDEVNGENGNTADLEALGMAEKLEHIFDLHTTQRMKASKETSGPQGQAFIAATSPASPNEFPPPGSGPASSTPKKPVRGVSIPSQRRFVGYWSRVLTREDPRPLDLLAPPNPSRLERVRRTVYINEIRVFMPDKMPGFPALIARKRINVHVARYRTGFVDSTEKRELDLREVRRLEKRLKKGASGEEAENDRRKLQEYDRNFENWDDNDWDDKTSMFEKQGVLTELSGSTDAIDGIDEDDGDAVPSGKQPPYRHLRPKPQRGFVDERVAVDADREVQLKLLVGKSGSKHSLLPDVGSLGYFWFIPAFEAPALPNADLDESLRCSVSFGASEIDFFKAASGIERVEVDLEWAVY